jgi:short-subunit dehydrogenase
MQKLNAKVVVITGAGSGMGRAIALKLAAEGAALALNDYHQGRLKQIGQELAPYGINFSLHLADISNPQETSAFVQEVMEKHGRVDVLINNAGVSLGRMEFEEISLDHWEWILKINLLGQIYCTLNFLPHIRRQPAGHIINVGSIYSFVAAKHRSAYVASKFALRGFSETLRQELRNSNVALTIVIPGMVSTNITNNGKGWKCPQEQARAAHVLKSKAPTSPEEAARKIISCLKSRKRLVLIGPDAKILYWLARLLPNYYDRILNFFVTRMEKFLGNKMKPEKKPAQSVADLSPALVKESELPTS